MNDVLILYSTTDGHTALICQRLAGRMQALGQAAQALSLAQCRPELLAQCAGVVIGASIRYGKHKPEVAKFIARYQPLLELRPSALFSVNVVARKPGKDVPEGNPYLQKFLRTITWRPSLLGVFAGRLDYARMKPIDRFMIRLIMWMGKGPTDPSGVYEFTDWRRVEAFAEAMVQQVSARARLAGSLSKHSGFAAAA